MTDFEKVESTTWIFFSFHLNKVLCLPFWNLEGCSRKEFKRQQWIGGQITTDWHSSSYVKSTRTGLLKVWQCLYVIQLQTCRKSRKLVCLHRTDLWIPGSKAAWRGQLLRASWVAAGARPLNMEEWPCDVSTNHVSYHPSFSHRMLFMSWEIWQLITVVPDKTLNCFEIICVLYLHCLFSPTSHLCMIACISFKQSLTSDLCRFIIINLLHMWSKIIHTPVCLLFKISYLRMNTNVGCSDRNVYDWKIRLENTE